MEEWGNHKSAVAYMGLGTYLGYFVSQNSRGHVLGHVKDLGEDPTQIDSVRIYRTNARYASPSTTPHRNAIELTDPRQFFHADDSDIVGLLCIARALEGGESDIASTHNVYNTLAAERPDVLKTLIEPIWYFDRKGETSKGQEEYIRTSVIYLERGDNARVYTKYAFNPPNPIIHPKTPLHIQSPNTNRVRFFVTDGIPTTSAPSAASQKQASYPLSHPPNSKPCKSSKKLASVWRST